MAYTRLVLAILSLLPLLGCDPPTKQIDPLVSFVREEHRLHFKKELSEWEAQKVVLAVKTLAPPDKVIFLLACGAEESHYCLGVTGDDGKSLGPYQLQHRYHQHVSKEMLQWDITTNTRCAVEHLKWAGWDAQVYNAGYEGKKLGRGRYHLRKVKKAEERIEQWLKDKRK
jgi:hypothetical protein